MIVCLDLEGVLVPEIWIGVAEKTGVPELRLTTRDIPDYDALMKRRIGILKRHKIRLADIQKVIGTLRPLPGAKSFLDRLRAERQVVILSDTFYQFAGPLMRQLGLPTIFCNRLIVGKSGYIEGYRLRQKDGKRKAVRALRGIGFEVRAAGDSYNDITMLQAAHKGVLFNPPAKIRKQYRRFKVVTDYRSLYRELTSAS